MYEKYLEEFNELCQNMKIDSNQLMLTRAYYITVMYLQDKTIDRNEKEKILLMALKFGEKSKDLLINTLFIGLHLLRIEYNNLD